MEKISEKIVELRIKSRLAVMCEEANKNTLSLKTKILFLLRRRPMPPHSLIASLSINKANLAMIVSKMQADGLIEKQKNNVDRREIAVAITEKGKKYLNNRLNIIEQNAIKTYNGDEYQSAAEKLTDAIAVLDFII